MEISAEDIKLMTNSTSGIQRKIKVKRQKLGTVRSFKYLGAVVSDKSSKPEVLSRIAGRVAQSVGHLTRKSGVLGSIPGLATYFRFSFRFFKKGSCQLLAKVCARSTG